MSESKNANGKRLSPVFDKAAMELLQHLYIIAMQEKAKKLERRRAYAREYAARKRQEQRERQNNDK